MALDLYNSIAIGSVWLTDTGASGGVPMISSVTGLDMLQMSKLFQTIVAIDGTPYIQTFTPVRGTPLSINFNWIPETSFFAVKDVINNAIDAATTITVQINGHTGDFNLTCYPGEMKFPGDFLGTSGLIKNVTYNFTISAKNYKILTETGSYSQTGNAVTLTH